MKEFQRDLEKSTESVAKLTYDDLVTILVRAKGLINQRPLVIDDDLRVITPMQLLQPTSSAAFGFETGQSIPRIKEQVRQVVEHFWSHWLSDYLTLMSVERVGSMVLTL